MHDKISAFFESAIASAISPVYLKLQNIRYTPVEGVEWCKYFYMPGFVRSGSLGARQIVYRGIVQVDVIFPSNLGPGAPSSTLSAIEAAFPIGGQFDVDGSQLSIESVSRGVSSDDPLWYTTPITVFWSLRKQQ